MAKETGLNWLVSISADNVNFYTLFCEQQSSITRGLDAIDATGKCDSGSKDKLAGNSDWSFSANGAYDSTNNAAPVIESAFDNRTKMYVKLTRSDAAAWSGRAFITKWEVQAPHDKEVSFSLELEGTGVLSHP